MNIPVKNVRPESDINTKVIYHYRDASNYKSITTIVLDGQLTDRQVMEIMNCCQNDGDCLQFVPEAIGLPLERPGVYSEQDDHSWAYFFLTPSENFKDTVDRRNTSLTPEQFVALFTENQFKWEALATTQDAINNGTDMTPLPASFANPDEDPTTSLPDGTALTAEFNTLNQLITLVDNGSLSSPAKIAVKNYLLNARTIMLTDLMSKSKKG